MTAPTPMIRFSCLGILFALGIVAPSVCAQAAIGAFGGIDLTDLSGDAPNNARYTSDVGFAVGAVGELRLAADVWLSVQPTWIQRGSRIAFAVRGEEELNDSLVLGLDPGPGTALATARLNMRYYF